MATDSKNMFRLQECLMGILSKLRRRDKAQYFWHPVNGNIVTDYYSIITSPMDFSTMEKKIIENAYHDFEGFQSDLFLIIANCRIYNAKNTPFVKSACLLEAWWYKSSPRFHSLASRWSLHASSSSAHSPHSDASAEIRAEVEPSATPNRTPFENANLCLSGTFAAADSNRIRPANQTHAYRPECSETPISHSALYHLGGKGVGQLSTIKSEAMQVGDAKFKPFIDNVCCPSNSSSVISSSSATSKNGRQSSLQPPQSSLHYSTSWDSHEETNSHTTASLASMPLSAASYHSSTTPDAQAASLAFSSSPNESPLAAPASETPYPLLTAPPAETPYHSLTAPPAEMPYHSLTAPPAEMPYHSLTAPPAETPYHSLTAPSAFTPVRGAASVLPQSYMPPSHSSLPLLRSLCDTEPTLAEVLASDSGVDNILMLLTAPCFESDITNPFDSLFDQLEPGRVGVAVPSGVECRGSRALEEWLIARRRRNVNNNKVVNCTVGQSEGYDEEKLLWGEEGFEDDGLTTAFDQFVGRVRCKQ